MIERLLAGRVQLALVGETQVDERIELDPLPHRRDRRHREAGPARHQGRADQAGRAGRADPARARGGLEHPADGGARAARRCEARPARVWELDSSEAIKRAAREGLGIAFLSRYAVAEEIERGELASFRLAGQPRIERRLHVARLARRPLSPSERGFIATLTRCCAKNAEFAAACVG